MKFATWTRRLTLLDNIVYIYIKVRRRLIFTFYPDAFLNFDFKVWNGKLSSIEMLWILMSLIFFISNLISNFHLKLNSWNNKAFSQWVQLWKYNNNLVNFGPRFCNNVLHKMEFARRQSLWSWEWYALQGETVKNLRFIPFGRMVAIVYVRTVDFDLQNDVSGGDHKLFRGRKCSARARKVAVRRVLYARHGAGTRFRYQNAVVVVVIIFVVPPGWSFARRNGPSPTRGIFHIARRTVRRSFKATLIADIRGARRRVANEN